MDTAGSPWEKDSVEEGEEEEEPEVEDEDEDVNEEDEAATEVRAPLGETKRSAKGG